MEVNFQFNDLYIIDIYYNYYQILYENNINIYHDYLYYSDINKYELIFNIN